LFRIRTLDETSDQLRHSLANDVIVEHVTDEQNVETLTQVGSVSGKENQKETNVN
jgi:hypothetical protein